MIAEVISIGDEMTSGQRLDTNSQWLSLALGDLGLRTMYHTTVGDDLAANVQVFREAVSRVDVIIATGGLGPTADDLTRQALADLLNVDLVQDDDALAHIRALFARRKRAMPERNVVQALFPRGSRVVPNPHGSAPGVDLDIPRDGRPAVRIFALPGVPAEMKEMWTQTVEPALRLQLGDTAQTIVHRVIRCFGIGESDLEAMLPDLIARTHLPLVGITVSQATISLRITAAGKDRDDALAALEPTAKTIYDCLGNLVFGEGEDEPQHAIARLIQQRGLSLTTCEVGTGGMLADWLSEATSTESNYVGGEVVRGAVENSEAAVRSLAARVREQRNTDYALSIGPFPALTTSDQEPDHVRFAIASRDGVWARSALFSGHPGILKDRSAKQALNFLRLHLLGQDSIG